MLVEHLHRTLETGFTHPLSGEAELLLRNRGRRYPAAVPRCRVNGETSPSGPDLQHLVVGREPQLLADTIQLGSLCLLECGLRVPEVSTRVRESRIEKQPEEFV